MKLRRKAYFSGAAQVVNITVDQYRGPFTARNEALAAGWDGTRPVVINVNVTAQGVIEGLFGGSYAFDTGLLPAGSATYLSVVPGGQVWGRYGLAGSAGTATASSANSGGPGGNAGHAIRAQAPLYISNQGTIAAGGGGGGGAGGAVAFGTSGNPAAFASGPAGGSGMGYNQTNQAPASGGGYTSNPAGGATATAGYAGSGGAPGLDGSAGTSGSIGGTNSGGGAGSGGPGGLRGSAVVGGEWVTWQAHGDVRGEVIYTAGTSSTAPTPAATPALGASFEGGIYTGNIVWQEVAQASPSPLKLGGYPGISQGSNPWLTLVVPEMQGNPLFYVGQTVQVRSRSNPALRMTCSVVACAGPNLTLRATAVSNAGTADDWSVMARFRIIQAPAAYEFSAALMGANTPMPLECVTLNEGARATAAMLAAGDAAAYPAAHIVKGLSIGGKTDWYIPSRDEEEGGWRFTKPASVNNYTTANRAVSAWNYARRGAANDTAAGHGVNSNAENARTAYAASSPAQVAAGLGLRVGETNARVYPGATYLTCSEFSDSEVWAQRYDTSEPGRQVAVTKTTVGRIRPVRRSIL